MSNINFQALTIFMKPTITLRDSVIEVFMAFVQSVLNIYLQFDYYPSNGSCRRILFVCNQKGKRGRGSGFYEWAIMIMTCSFTALVLSR